MKRTFYTALAMMLLASGTLRAQQLSALFSYATFNLVNGDPYVETYVDYDAWTLHFTRQSDGQYKATVETTLLVMSGDSIVFAKKYDLSSPNVSDSSHNAFNFLDIQRFALKNGIYNLRMILRDKNSGQNPVEINEKLVVNYGNLPQMSSVLPMSSIRPTISRNMLSRNGFDMEPYINDFVPQQVKALNFYYEIYHLNHEIFNADFITVAFIETQETGDRIAGIEQTQHHKGDVTVPVFGGLDISKLPSGNYNLVAEVRNKDNQLLLYSKVPFMRSNPAVKMAEATAADSTFAGNIKDETLLNFYLHNLIPIATKAETQYIRELVSESEPGKLQEKQVFFYKFWTSRNKLNAAGEWKDYKTRIDYVAANFGNTNYAGYETDRGRVYLQYGPPTYVRDEKNYVSMRRFSTPVSTSVGIHTNGGWEASVQNSSDNIGGVTTGQIHYLPFQLWRYDRIPGEDPVRCFIFWDEFRTGLYKMLNSNVRGETIMADWEFMLSQKQLPSNTKGDVGEMFDKGF